MAFSELTPKLQLVNCKSRNSAFSKLPHLDKLPYPPEVIKRYDNGHKRPADRQYKLRVSKHRLPNAFWNNSTKPSSRDKPLNDLRPLLHVAKKKVAFFNAYPDFCQPVTPLDNISVLMGKHSPVLIIHGMKDEVIPYSEAEENFARASEPKQFLSLPHATHNWKEPDWNLYIDGIHKFLIDLPKSS